MRPKSDRASDDSWKLLALALISPARPSHRLAQPQSDVLTDSDWTEILRMARQHRIGPMMRWQLQWSFPLYLEPNRPGVVWDIANSSKDGGLHLEDAIYARADCICAR